MAYTKHQKITIDVNKKLKPIDRLRLADLIVNHIVERTRSGKDNFPKYSKEYIKSLDFKNAGKSKNKVDLTLSGDMLAELSIINHRNGKITVGFEKGSEANGKADGNIRGTYGTSTPNKKKARDFLYIKANEVKKLERQVKKDVAENAFFNTLSTELKKQQAKKLQDKGIIDGRLNIKNIDEELLDELLLDQMELENV